MKLTIDEMLLLDIYEENAVKLFDRIQTLDDWQKEWIAPYLKIRIQEILDNISCIYKKIAI